MKTKQEEKMMEFLIGLFCSFMFCLTIIKFNLNKLERYLIFSIYFYLGLKLISYLERRRSKYEKS